MEIVPHTVEQALTNAEENGHETDLHFVHEISCQVLLSGLPYGTLTGSS